MSRGWAFIDRDFSCFPLLLCRRYSDCSATGERDLMKRDPMKYNEAYGDYCWAT